MLKIIRYYLLSFSFSILFIQYSQASEIPILLDFHNDSTLTIDINNNLFFYNDENQVISHSSINDSLETGRYMIHTSLKNGETIIQLIRKQNSERFIGNKFSSLLENPNILQSLPTDSISVICFWNTHCPPCIKELTILNWLADDFPRVKFIALSNESDSILNNFFNQHKITWKSIHLMSGYPESLEIDVLPTTFLLNREGFITNAFNGNIKDIIITLDRLDNSEY